MCFSLLWEAHFWKAAQSILHHFTSKNSCFGPLSDTKMRHFGHFRPPWNLKKRRKNVYYLFMRPLGPPKAHTCMHHTCHLKLAKPFLMIFNDFLKMFNRFFCDFFLIFNRLFKDLLTIFHRLFYDCFICFHVFSWFFMIFHDCFERAFHHRWVAHGM